MSRFTNHTDGIPGPQGPAGESANTGDFVFEGSSVTAPGDISILSNTVPGTINISAYAGINIAYSKEHGGAYLNGISPENQIATIADISNLESSLLSPVAIRWSPIFSATGLAFTGSNGTYPTYNSYYIKHGQLVSFWIEVNLSTVTNFGTGQLMLRLPSQPLASAMNHFPGWVNVDPSVNPDNAGHVILNADHMAGTDILDLHYIKQNGGANSPIMEAIFKQGTPVTLTTSSKIYVNGTYISAS